MYNLVMCVYVYVYVRLCTTLAANSYSVIIFKSIIMG